MAGHIFITRGDITRLSADALVYPVSRRLNERNEGLLFKPFCKHVPGFQVQFGQLQPRQPLGATRWLDLRGEPDDGRRPCGVVVVVSTAGRLSPDQEEQLLKFVPGLKDEIVNSSDNPVIRALLACTAYAVWQAIEEAASRLRRGRPRDGQREPEPYLVALPTIGQGQGGTREFPLASARVMLRAAHAALRDKDDVDVVFVPFTPHSYEVLLQARTELQDMFPAGYPEGPVAEGEPSVAELAAQLEKAVHGRHCVLFIGSGLSTAAGFPSWDRLNEGLAGELGILDDREAGEEFQRRKRDLDYSLDLAQWYADRHGSEALTQQVYPTYGNTEGRPIRPTVAHYLLMSLSVRSVMTTNYDDLLEQALLGLRRYPEKVVELEQVARTVGGTGVPVVKFHGDAPTRRRIVLKRDDYHRFFHEHPDMDLLLRGLLLNHTFLFVGYSLRDPNFLQIHNHVRQIMGRYTRQAFVINVEENRLTTGFQQSYWRARNLEVLTMPGETFSDRVRSLHRFLDRLAAQTRASQSPVLNRKVPFAPAVDGLGPKRDALIRLADELSEFVPWLADSLANAGPSKRGQVFRGVAKLLVFLSAHGWSPRGNHSALLRLWNQVAELAPSDDEKRRLLITAFQYAEKFDEVEELRGRIAQVTPPDSQC